MSVEMAEPKAPGEEERMREKAREAQEQVGPATMELNAGRTSTSQSSQRHAASAGGRD